jgi:hypothetical protein
MPDLQAAPNRSLLAKVQRVLRLPYRAFRKASRLLARTRPDLRSVPARLSAAHAYFSREVAPPYWHTNYDHFEACLASLSDVVAAIRCGREPLVTFEEGARSCIASIAATIADRESRTVRVSVGRVRG